MEWYSTATPDDLALMEKVEGFGYLFDDMCFKEGSATFNLISYKCQDGKTRSDSLPDELSYFDYSHFRYKAQDLDDCLGYFDSANSLLCVPVNAEKTIILHEMIHLHEDVYKDLPLFIRDMAFWALYTDLKDKILKDGEPALDEIITNHAHMLNGVSIFEAGGNHSLLFLLKSFDLDIRFGYQLGTIFGYGKIDDFKGYSYTKSE